MSKVLRVHNKSNADVQGIGVVPSCVTIGDFAGVPDPLSVGSAHNVNVLAEKPASSIPSVFARMIFFRMAFGGIEPNRYVLQPGDPISVYNRAISQCFDLLEIVFNKQRGLRVECFDFSQQIQALHNDNNPNHKDFAEALQKQKDKFLPEVDCVYLFYLNDELMGGTSKYSMVFTSPNWNSGKPVRSLLERDLEFRLFVYKYARAYNRTASWGTAADEKAFYEYVSKCLHADQEAVDLVPEQYTVNDLMRDYPVLELPVNEQDTRIFIQEYGKTDKIQLFLFNRPQDQFTSDFFIKSTVHRQINRDRTPLVLAEGQYYGMKYYDQEAWNAATKVPQIEHNPNHPEDKNNLPGCDAYSHPYLTEVDFLEENLLALPFTINTDEFYGGIDLGDGYSAMIPVKPLFFQYFKREDLDGMMEWRQRTKELVLSIPVCDVQGTLKGKVVFRKQYTEADICYLKDKEEKEVRLSLGVFPLLKAQAPIVNNYWIRFGMDPESNYNEADLNYYRIGSEQKIQCQDALRRDVVSKSWHQNVGDFDYAQIVLPEADGMHKGVKAIVVPRFRSVSANGNHQYTYAIDFGTTNTHIAYSVDGGQAVSFKDGEIKQQVAYLDRFEKTKEGNLEMLEAREFFPHFGEGGGIYSFPIRTVVNTNGNVNGTENSVLFSKTSIGFRYPNEKIQNTQYQTDLKWKYLTNPLQGVNNKNVEAYFEEIMRMIKTHWLSKEFDPNQKPKIVLTYPLAGKEGLGRMIDGWNQAYDRVFGGQGNIGTMAESLAPCIKSIRQNQAGMASGILNIDIGGGSTDIQYYMKNVSVGERSFYDSIVFAGDDLWGIGNENLSVVDRPVGITNNRFTELANQTFDQAVIMIGGETVYYKDIRLSDCKEKVNMLLRDKNNNLTNLLRTASDPNTRICRLHMFLHYSAIMYQVAKWMQTNELSIPRTVSLTGLGSLYVHLLFPTVQDLNAFTKSLFETYYSGCTVPAGFSVKFEDNPKNVTAEGATMTIAGMANPVENCYYGYAGNRAVSAQNIGTVINDTMDSFDEYLNGFETCSGRAGNVVPSLTVDERTTLRDSATNSLNDIATAYQNRHQGGPQDQLEESTFIWTLKNSLWTL